MDVDEREKREREERERREQPRPVEGLQLCGRALPPEVHSPADLVGAEVELLSEAALGPGLALLPQAVLLPLPRVQVVVLRGGGGI